MPVIVAVRVLPSADATDLKVVVTLPFSFVHKLESASIDELMRSGGGTAAPITGRSMPSNLTMISACVG